MLTSAQIESMPLQVFVAREAGETVNLDEIPRGKVKIEDNNWLPKPKGAFWTSSLVGSTTAWLDWCLSEMPLWIGSEAAIFRVRPCARVEVATEENVRRLDGIYQNKGRAVCGPIKGMPLSFFDWAAFSEDRDGLWLQSPEVLQLWDVESTAWLNPAVLELLEVVKIESVEGDRLIKHSQQEPIR